MDVYDTMFIFSSPAPGPTTKGQDIHRSLAKFGKKPRLATAPNVALKKKTPLVRDATLHVVSASKKCLRRFKNVHLQTQRQKK